MAVTGEAPPADPASDAPRRGASGHRSSAVEPDSPRHATTTKRASAVFVISVLAAIAGLATNASTRRGAMASGVTELGIAGALLSFATLILAPFAEAAQGGVPAPSYRRHLRTWALRIVPVAWLVVIVAYLFAPETGAAQASVSFGTAASGATSVPFAAVLRGLTFTSPYGPGALVGPVAHLWPVSAALLFVLLAPFLARLLWPVATASEASAAGTEMRGQRHSSTRPWLVLAGLAGSSTVFRILAATLASGRIDAVHWAPAHLDAFAAGAAVLMVASSPAQPLSRLRDWLRSLTGVVVIGALSYFALFPFGLVRRGLPRDGTVVSGGNGLLQHLAFVVVAASLTLLALVGQSGRRVIFGRGSAFVRRSVDRGARASQAEPERPKPGALLIGAASRFAYPAYAWSAIVLGRWVSAPASVPGGDPAPARHPGALGAVSMVPTIVWTVGISFVLGALTWALLMRPLHRAARRGVGWFAGGLWAVSLISFALRIWSFGTLNSRNAGNGDPFFYHSQANMLADGVGFGEPFTWLAQNRFVPSAIHPPLFTLWLTPSSMLGARGFLAHKVMAAIAGVGVVVVAALLARRLAGPRAGLIAGGLVALYPDLWIVDGTLWPEGLYTALAGLALLAAYRWLERPGLGRAAAIGGAVGLAILTRGEALLALGFLCLPLAFAGRRRVSRWPVHAAVMGAVALGLLAPWTVRNSLSFDRAVPVSTNSEEVLYYANCPDTYGGPLIGYWSFSCQQRARVARVADGLSADPPGDEAERAAGWAKLGRRYALDHTDRWPAVVTARVLRVWDLRHADTTARALTFEGRPYVWSTRGLLAYRILLLPGLVGLVVLWRRRATAVWPLIATLAMVTFTAATVYGHIRFRTTGDLVLLVGAAIAVDALLQFRTPARENGTTPT